MMQSVMQGCMQQMMGRMAGGGGDLDIRYGNGGGNGAGNNGDGGDAAPNELSRLKRSRTDNFWGRRHEAERQHANAEDRKGQRPLLDAPTSRDDAGGAERGDDDVPDADDMDADNDAEAPPKVPGQARVRDALGDLESTMRDRKAVTKVTAKAKAKAKAEAKAADKAATLATKASAKAPAKLPKGAKFSPPKKAGPVMSAMRVADEPKTPYKGPKLEPMLAHILCAARLNLSPTKGAFCTAGSNNAARALQLKGHTPDVQKAAGRHGWALAAAYWDKHRK
jgi:hypothetical protein